MGTHLWCLKMDLVCLLELFRVCILSWPSEITHVIQKTHHYFRQQHLKYTVQSNCFWLSVNRHYIQVLKMWWLKWSDKHCSILVSKQETWMPTVQPVCQWSTFGNNWTQLSNECSGLCLHITGSENWTLTSWKMYVWDMKGYENKISFTDKKRRN